MMEHRNRWAIKTMAQVLRVSRQGYYAWLATKDKRVSRHVVLDVLVYSEYRASKGRNGYRRIQTGLAEKGHTYGHNTIQRSMQRQQIRGRMKRRFVKTTDSNHTLPVYPNILKRYFTATLPNQKWAGDVTYVWTNSGWVYLAKYLDLCTRKVVGWSMSENIDAALVCSALKDALVREGFPMGVVVHTDRGRTYCSDAYREMVRDYSLRGSMSRKGNCWDNAVAESWFGILKRELEDMDTYMDLQAAYDSIFEFINCWYNTMRHHSSIGYKSPVNFEKELLQSHQQSVQ